MSGSTTQRIEHGAYLGLPSPWCSIGELVWGLLLPPTGHELLVNPAEVARRRAAVVGKRRPPNASPIAKGWRRTRNMDLNKPSLRPPQLQRPS